MVTSSLLRHLRYVILALSDDCMFSLSFILRSILKATIKCESPLYEINKVDLDVSNPFPHKGKFRVVLVEARGQFANTTSKEKRIKTKAIKKVESKTDHG